MEPEIREHHRTDFSGALSCRRSSRYMNSAAEMLSTGKSDSSIDFYKNRDLQYLIGFSRCVSQPALDEPFISWRPTEGDVQKDYHDTIQNRSSKSKLPFLLEIYYFYLIWIHFATVYTHEEFIKHQPLSHFEVFSQSSLHTKKTC